MENASLRGGMGEDLPKWNTDCVYFLASPLTCRKGAECEYRHSEAARLNPRDCWYWLSGNCLNACCGFRHPPLEKQTESSTESGSLQPQQPQQSQQSQAVVSTNKSNVPCYFYFNGFCNRGEKCTFSHGPDMHSLKSAKSSLVVTGANQGENKTSIGREVLPISKKPSLKTLGAPSKDLIDVEPKHEKFQRAESKYPVHPFQSFESQQMQDVLVDSNARDMPADLFQSKNGVISYENQERQVEDHVEPEERLESSPGFDVLVDDKSEYLTYQDDEEYRQGIDRECMELNGHFMGDEFVDLNEYDPSYPNSDLYIEREMIDSCGRVDLTNGNGDSGNYDSGFPRDGLIHSSSNRKRRFKPSEVGFHDSRNTDLRDHLRRRRVSDGRGDIGDEEGDAIYGQRRLVMSERLRERLVLDVDDSGEQLRSNGSVSNEGVSQRSWGGGSRSSKYRDHFHDRRPTKRQFPSVVVKKPDSTDRRSDEELSVFSGPKTLAQIKEDKKKYEASADLVIETSEVVAADFEGPKPLREILKDKRKLTPL